MIAALAPTARGSAASRGSMREGFALPEILQGSIKTPMTYEDLLGKEFAYGGRGPKVYDCYGLCMEVLRRTGVQLPDFGSAIQSHIIHEMILTGKELFTELPAAAPFCIVTFWIRPKYTTHIAVVLEDGNRFIHILKKERVVIERLDSVLWKHRITGYFVPSPIIGDGTTKQPLPSEGEGQRMRSGLNL
jgi:hypothetical protein